VTAFERGTQSVSADRQRLSAVSHRSFYQGEQDVEICLVSITISRNGLDRAGVEQLANAHFARHSQMAEFTRRTWTSECLVRRFAG
jgi:hypothetical protein